MVGSNLFFARFTRKSGRRNLEIMPAEVSHG